MEVKEFTEKEIASISDYFQIDQYSPSCGGVLDVKQSKLDAMNMTLDEYFDHKRKLLIDSLCLRLKESHPDVKIGDKYFVNKEIGEEESKIEIFLSISTPKA